MQNKGAIWTFTILLALASLYQLSFSYFTTSFEKKAESYAQLKTDSVAATANFKGYQLDSIKNYWSEKFIKNNGGESVYPVFGYNYQEAKSREINLGLDLQGGMSVTLEISIPDLVDAYAGKSKDQEYRDAFNFAKDAQLNDNRDFITLFEEAWKSTAGDRDIIEVFHRLETKEKFPANSNNKEVFEILRKEATAAVDGTEQVISSRINKFGVSQPSIQKQFATGRIQLELPGVKDKNRVRRYLQSTANLEFWAGGDLQQVYSNLMQLDLELSNQYFPGYRDSVDKLAKEAQDSTSNQDLAVNDSTSGDFGDDIFGDTEAENSNGETQFDQSQIDSKKYSPLLSVLYLYNQPGTFAGIAQVTDTVIVNKYLNTSIAKSLIPRGIDLLWDYKEEADPKTGVGSGNIRLYVIQKNTNKPLLDGKAIEDASGNYSPITSQPEISLVMNAKGAQKWKKVTTEYKGKIVAITLDNQVLTAPTINDVIPNGYSVISGNYTFEQATDIANILKAGALPAPAKIIDEAFVGPSLGQDNIKSGLISFAVALLVVLLYMIFYYNKGGIAADIALVTNLFFLVGVLASLQASLTLPGIAGIVLTVGMSVDANVLIFERIREELRSGKVLGQAVTDGYKNSLWSILDANITTLITAAILTFFGTGPIKGFGVTLMIGIATSLFTALFISRLIIDRWISNKKDVSFSTKTTENLFGNTQRNFISKRKIAYGISGLIIVIGIVSLFTKGLDYGVEFSGGTNYRVKFEEPVKIDEVRSALNQSFVDAEGKAANTEIKTVENAYQIAIKTNFLIDNQAANADSVKEAALTTGLNTIYPTGNYQILDSRSVDPTISNDFKRSSMVVIIVAILAIFIYIVLRFSKWQFGAGAIVAIFHDVLIVLSIFSLLHGILPFSMSIDQAFIAAILTVVGYSINDTVVVFDRIREFFGKFSKKDRGELMNNALNSTISRTINTSLSTFIVLLIIFLFGGESIKGFVFALMIGIIVGTYSSIFIATPIVYDLAYKGDDEKKKEE